MTSFPQLQLEKVEGPKVTLHTNHGDIKIVLFEEHAPKAVENFLTHAKDGYYDGIAFHRIIKDFMIQGGDPTGTGAGGESIWGEPFEDEISREVFNLNGALSMANAGPDTNGSQFFIVTLSEVPQRMQEQLAPAGYPEEIIEVFKEEGGTPWLDGAHTVFGHVIEGMDVVNEIQAVETNMSDKPLEDVVIESTTVEEV